MSVSRSAAEARIASPGGPLSASPAYGPSTVVDQLDALRRVALLTARGVDSAAVLDAVVSEAFGLFDVDFTALLEYEADGAASIIAVHHGPPGLVIGERAPHIPDGLVLRVFHSLRPVRVEAYADVPGPAVARMHELGIVAGAAAPILVEGQLWGVLTAMTRSGPVAPGIEHRLADFAEIAAAAISSAKARADLHQIALEHEALRRVAELVARGTGGQPLFDFVADEAAALIGDEATTLVRFTGVRSLTVLATHDGPAAAGSTIEVPDDDEGLVAEILRTRRPARLDDYESRTGPLFAQTTFGVGSSVAVPIMVEERMWGMLGVSTAGPQLPAGTEQRLQQFTELVAAALANSQAKATVEQLAKQQAALREVAEVAARDAPSDQVLQAVAAQAADLAGVNFTTVLRYEPDGGTEIMALSGAPESLAPGMRAPAGGDGAVQRVWHTRRSARIDNLATMTGQWPRIAHDCGFSTSAAVPILIQGDLWGALVAVGRRQPLPASVQDDLTSFADLAGTAISAAQARHELRSLADEQAALRRVAELVARGTALDEVFNAVAAETSKLFAGLPATLHRHYRDGSSTIVAACEGAPASTSRLSTELTAPIAVEGHVWGALTTSSSGSTPPAEDEARLQHFAGLAAAAIANAYNKAQLTASRARVVATADETRRRLQRDVHDGAQQRLVQTIITLKIARDAVGKSDPVHGQIIEALYHAERANAELRDLVHGILPASLTQGGLRTGLESLITDISIPVHLRLTAPRLSTQAETTAYFIVAEALTNVVKHAQATHADVTVRLDGSALEIEVCDDGIGGADPAAGTGLIGLSDRVEAADGDLTITSAAGRGTKVRAVVPLADRLP